MYEPRVMDVPGFDTPLKEASLEEFMSALPIDHMAQKQLSDLRRLAMDGAKATSELLEALKKIRELEVRDHERAKEVEKLLWQVGDLQNKLNEVPTYIEEPEPEKTKAPKAQCPHCSKLISTLPGPWARHMNFAHPNHDQATPKSAPNPTSAPPNEV